MRLLLVVLILSLSTAYAEVYRSVGKDGTVTYSDRPSQGAESIDVPPTSSYAPPPLPSFGSARSSVEGDGSSEQQPGAYRSFALETPADDEAVRENAGNVPFSFLVEPPLQAGHSIKVMLDGLPVTVVSVPSGSLENVDRGTHSLAGELLDENGRLIEKSNAVQFHLLRVNIGGVGN